MSITPETIISEIVKILETCLDKKHSGELPLSVEQKILFCEIWNDPKHRSAIENGVMDLINSESGKFFKYNGYNPLSIDLKLSFETDDEGRLFVVPLFSAKIIPYAGNYDFSVDDEDTIFHFPFSNHFGAYVVAFIEENLGIIKDRNARILELVIAQHFDVSPNGYTFSLQTDAKDIHSLVDMLGLSIPNLIVTETEETRNARLSKAENSKKRLLEVFGSCPHIKRRKVN